jgi:hypothetical protein
VPTIFEISGEWTALIELLEETGGDVSDPDVSAYVDKCFEEIDVDLERKVDGYLVVINELKARADARKAEADRLAKRARVDTTTIKTMKERLTYYLQLIGREKIETERFKVTVANAGGKQPLTIDDGPLPTDWVDVKTTETPAKDRIRAFLDQGNTLPFARLEERGKVLRVS